MKATKMKAYLALLFLVYFIMPGLCRRGRKIVFDTSTDLPDIEYSNEGLPALVLMSTMMISAGLL